MKDDRKVHVGQRVLWNREKKMDTVFAWRLDNKGEIEIKVSSSGNYWSIWFFTIYEDGNDILKEML